MKGLVIRTKEEIIYYSGSSEEEFKINKEKAIEEAKAKFYKKNKYKALEVVDKETKTLGNSTFGTSIIRAKYETYETYDEDKIDQSKATETVLFVIGIICFIIQLVAFFISMGSTHSSENTVGYIDSLRVYDVVTNTNFSSAYIPSSIIMMISTIVLGIIAFVSTRLDIEYKKSTALIILMIIALVGSLYCLIGYACAK